jgi:hypothetical protein
MAAIDRETLVIDVKFWLPSDNTLTDEVIAVINEYVITQVMTLRGVTDEEDEDLHYAEVLCKSLEANALKNMTSQAVGTSSYRVKREKVRHHEKEYVDSPTSNRTNWRDYIKDLVNICPIFGYSPRARVGIFVSPGLPVDATPNSPCDCE